MKCEEEKKNMKRKKKKVCRASAATALLLASAMVLTACGSSSTSSTSSESSSAASQESVSSESEASAASASETSASASDTITVTDYTGEQVEIPAHAEHIGAIYGGAPPMVMFFDVADRVACSMSTTENSWCQEIYPEWSEANIQAIENPRDPNVEELAALDVDLVFYWADLPDVVEKMTTAGIPVVVATPAQSDLPETFEELRSNYEFQFTMYATAFGGGEYLDKAEEWLNWYDTKMAYLLDRTSSLSDDERPRCYVTRNQEDGLQTWGKGYTTNFMIEAAGGTSVTADWVVPGGKQFDTVTMEQMAEWDPEYVFTGWLDSTDYITENEQWSTITAVKEGHVYLCPASMSTSGWEGGEMAPLWAMFVAKQIHPDLFEDLDLVAEVQEYYKTFYDYDLSEQGAQWMLDRCDAQGNPVQANNH